MEAPERPTAHEATVIASMQVACNRIFARAFVAYATDPDLWICIRDAIRRGLEDIERCIEDGGTGGGPNCPPGTIEVDGKCIPDF